MIAAIYARKSTEQNGVGAQGSPGCSTPSSAHPPFKVLVMSEESRPRP
jgi:hypothetical protein